MSRQVLLLSHPLNIAAGTYMSFYFDSFKLNKVIYISRNQLIKMTGLSKRCKNDNRQHQEVSYSFVLDQDFALIHSVTKYAL